MVSPFGMRRKLHERGARRVVVHGFADIRAGDQIQFLQLGIENIPQRHQVGARFFQGGEVFLQIETRFVRQLRAELAGAVPDDFVQRGHQVFGFVAVLFAAVDLLREKPRILPAARIPWHDPARGCCR